MRARLQLRFSVLLLLLIVHHLAIAAAPRADQFEHAAVVSQERIASQVGAAVLQRGGNAVDAAVATAFALAVTHPAAGNIGGGGFLVFRSSQGNAVAYDFREVAPAAAGPSMFLREGRYDAELHHNSHVAAGVPGTVAGLHLAWREQGSRPWKELVEPAVALARDGFIVSEGLARSLRTALPRLRKYPASMAQFTRGGQPYQAGDRLVQADLARTLQRIADEGPRGFYEGPVAERIEQEMRANGGLITREDLKQYRAIRREPVRGTYRGHEILSMPPGSSGGVALIEMLNILEWFNLRQSGPNSAATVHLIAEAMRRAFSDRAQHLGDPAFNPRMPIAQLISKEYAAEARRAVLLERAGDSRATNFAWPRESAETTHLSVVDSNRNAVALTYTLEESYGSGIVVPGGGFLLNNEMGDFNPAPGLWSTNGWIGSKPNLAAPGKRMLSSMTPTIVARDGKLFMVTGSPGGRTIINTVLLTILNVIDFGMDAQAAVDAPRFHHQWLPDRIQFERGRLRGDVVEALRRRGHTMREVNSQGVAEILVVTTNNFLEAGIDRRDPDSGASGF